MRKFQLILAFILWAFIFIETNCFSAAESMYSNQKNISVHVEVWPTFDCELFKERFDKKKQIKWFKPRFTEEVKINSEDKVLTPYEFLVNLLQKSNHPRMYKHIKQFRIYRKSFNDNRYTLVHKENFSKGEQLINAVNKGDILVFHG